MIAAHFCPCCYTVIAKNTGCEMSKMYRQRITLVLLVTETHIYFGPVINAITPLDENINYDWSGTSPISMFYHIIHFLSLVELESWLVDVADSSILVFKTLLGKVFPRPSLTQPKGSGVHADCVAPWVPDAGV